MPVKPQFRSGCRSNLGLRVLAINRGLRPVRRRGKEKADRKQQNASQFLRVDDLAKQSRSQPRCRSYSDIRTSDECVSRTRKHRLSLYCAVVPCGVLYRGLRSMQFDANRSRGRCAFVGLRACREIRHYGESNEQNLPPDHYHIRGRRRSGNGIQAECSAAAVANLGKQQVSRIQYGPVPT